MPRRKQQPDDRLLTVAQVAEMIGLDESTIYQGECETDELISIRVGTRVLYSYNDVQSWIRKRVSAAINKRRQKLQKEQMKAEIKDSIRETLRLVKTRNNRRQKGTTR